MELILSLIAGAMGGNIAGGLLRNLNLGVWGNAIVGTLGGGLGGEALSRLDAGLVAAVLGDTDTSIILGQLAAGGLGGGIGVLIVGAIRNLVLK